MRFWTNIFFNSSSFGGIFFEEDDLDQHSRIIKLGPDPLRLEGKNIIPHTWPFKSTRPIKAVLLDQTVLSGIGNIYADEALYGSKIYPGKLNSFLSKKEIKKIIQESKKALNKGSLYFF